MWFLIFFTKFLKYFTNTPLSMVNFSFRKRADFTNKNEKFYKNTNNNNAKT